MQHIEILRWFLASTVYLACMVGSVQAQCTRPQLDNPIVLSDADILLTEWTEGQQVTVKCDYGYVRLTGSTKITCSNGQWTPVTLKCEKKNCGSPGEIDNGGFNIPTGTLHGDKVVFYCNQGYHLVPAGHTERTCRDGTWTGKNPVCQVVQCGDPPSIVDGEQTTVAQDAYDYGSVVQYRCKDKYTLVGAASIVCSDDETWKPDPPQCKIVQCPIPQIENADRIDGRPPYGYRSFVTFKCKTGFFMEGQPTLTCNISSNWNHPYPTCTVVKCGAPPSIENGEQITPPRDSYDYNSVVEYRCKDNYTPVGQQSISCKEDKTWTDPPQCKLKTTKAPTKAPTKATTTADTPAATKKPTEQDRVPPPDPKPTDASPPTTPSSSTQTILIIAVIIPILSNFI